MRLTRLLALVANARARRTERPGNRHDVDEVEALCVHMDCRYLCPTLFRKRIYPN